MGTVPEPPHSIRTDHSGPQVRQQFWYPNNVFTMFWHPDSIKSFSLHYTDHNPSSRFPKPVNMACARLTRFSSHVNKTSSFEFVKEFDISPLNSAKNLPAPLLSVPTSGSHLAFDIGQIQKSYSHSHHLHHCHLSKFSLIMTEPSNTPSTSVGPPP